MAIDWTNAGMHMHTKGSNMQTKFTKGPWTTGGRMTQVEVWPEGWNAPMCVADCHAKHAPETEAERVANAALIAAAPELFAALEKLVAADNCNYDRHLMRYEGYFDAARAALAKARGS